MRSPKAYVEPRIGDAERDQTLVELSQHFAAGRLDLDEFEERSATALSARTQVQLDSTLVDLPGRPRGLSPAAPVRQVARPVVSVICAGAAAVALLMGIDDQFSYLPDLACPVQVQDC